MKSKQDWTMREWRDYYEKLRQKASDNYQATGEARYDREEYKYSKIVDAFNGYLENKSETDDAKLRRQHNIDAYADRVLRRDTFSRADVKELIRVIREF